MTIFFKLNPPLRILLSTNMLLMLAGAMLGPIYALFVEDIGGDLLDASMAGGTFALAAGITVLISGRYSDKVKRPDKIIILGYIIVGLGFLIYLFVDTIWWLLAVQLIIGFGEAIYTPPFDKLYSRNVEKGKAGRQWGAWESLDYFTTAFGALAGGMIVTYISFDTLFIIMAVLCFVSAIYLYYMPVNTSK